MAIKWLSAPPPVLRRPFQSERTLTHSELYHATINLNNFVSKSASSSNSSKSSWTFNFWRITQFFLTQGRQESQQVPHFFSPALCDFFFHHLQLLIFFCFFRRIFPAITFFSFELEGYVLSSLHLIEYQLDLLVIQHDNKPYQTCAQSDGIVQSSAPSACQSLQV